ncbi:UNVERIFIED_CONTAM: hypothetical protein HDU68_003621 [Siphonaria sp. JEL0065]|nr:hypothetical protein HDU68_003621 [Siphonaria sp. JEL0065]
METIQRPKNHNTAITQQFSAVLQQVVFAEKEFEEKATTKAETQQKLAAVLHELQEVPHELEQKAAAKELEEKATAKAETSKRLSAVVKDFKEEVPKE